MLPTKKPSSLSLVGKEARACDYATNKKILPTVTRGEEGPAPLLMIQKGFFHHN